MSGLVLKLRPREEVMINGAVVRNGDKKTVIRIQSDNAHVLRMQHLMRAEEATTPRRRAYFAAQLATAGQLPDIDASKIIEDALAEDQKTENPLPVSNDISRHIQHRDFYQVMRTLSPTLENDLQS